MIDEKVHAVEEVVLAQSGVDIHMRR